MSYLVYLEATCGCEFICTDPDDDHGSVVCPRHGELVSLWAQRNEPVTDHPLDLKAAQA